MAGVARASAPASSGGVSPPAAVKQGTRTETVLELAAGDGCATLPIRGHRVKLCVLCVLCGNIAKFSAGGGANLLARDGRKIIQSLPEIL